MNTTKRPRKKTSADSSAADIVNAYKQYVLINGSQPPSVYKFCVDLGINEDEFYNYFGSFEGLEGAIWKGFIDETLRRLAGDKSYATFSAQERILAFYYTLLEVFKSDRSFIVHQLGRQRRLEIIPSYLKAFRAQYEEYMKTVLNEGLKSGEIARRPYLEKGYPQIFWGHFASLLRYWKEDNSPSFEKTDAYVEKSVRLAFDLIGKGVIDSALDFAKFIAAR